MVLTKTAIRQKQMISFYLQDQRLVVLSPSSAVKSSLLLMELQPSKVFISDYLYNCAATNRSNHLMQVSSKATAAMINAQCKKKYISVAFVLLHSYWMLTFCCASLATAVDIKL